MDLSMKRIFQVDLRAALSPSKAATAPTAAAAKAGGVHWSQAPPLAENKVSAGDGAPVNLADGVYDEAAERRAFQVSARPLVRPESAGSRCVPARSPSFQFVEEGEGGGFRGRRRSPRLAE